MPRNIEVTTPQGQAQIFGVCPQSEISQFAAEKWSQTLTRVNGYPFLKCTAASDTMNIA